MSDTQTVFHNGNGLLVQQTVLEEMGLTPGQSITEVQMWKCIELNATALAADIAIRRATGEDAPDTSLLEASLANIAARR
jgi:hypothetical protein